MQYFFIFVVFLYGAIIGSFLNVCIYRIPKNISIVFPSSHCPVCKNKLYWWHNIPIFSYIILGGRCYFCKTKIPIRYPLVEFLTGLIFVVIYINFSLSFEFFYYIVVFSYLIVIFFIDLDTYYVYDKVVFSAIAIGFLGSFFVNIKDPIISTFVKLKSWQLSFLGILFSFVFFYIIFIFAKVYLKLKYLNSDNLIHKILYSMLLRDVNADLEIELTDEGMGSGDILVAMFIGSFLGPTWALISFFIAFIMGSFIGIIYMIYTYFIKKKRIFFIPVLDLNFAYLFPVLIKDYSEKLYLAFTPFLVLGVLVVFFLKPYIVNFLNMNAGLY